MYFLLAYLMFADWAWGPTNDPNQLALWQDGRQVGVWKIAPGEYLALNGRNFTFAQCPTDPPAKSPDPDFVGPPEPEKKAMPEKPGEINFGLDKSELRNDGELYSYNGAPVDKAEAEDLLAGGKLSNDRLTDDSQAIRLTAVGKDGKKTIDALKADPRWAELAEGVVAKSYPSDHWIVKERGYKAASSDRPTLYLTSANGDLLYEGEDSGALFDALRRRRDPWSINWNSWNIGINPFTWMAGLAWSSLHIPVEWVLLVIGAIVIGVLLIKKKPGPPAQPGRVK